MGKKTKHPCEHCGNPVDVFYKPAPCPQCGHIAGMAKELCCCPQCTEETDLHGWRRALEAQGVDVESKFKALPGVAVKTHRRRTPSIKEHATAGGSTAGADSPASDND